MKRFLSKLFGKVKQVRRTSSKRQRAQLALELLERRDLMAAALFVPEPPLNDGPIIIGPPTASKAGDIFKGIFFPPALSSNPGAPATLFLNFGGDFTANWFRAVNGVMVPGQSYDNITTPVFDL